MEERSADPVTVLLSAAANGDSAAADHLFPILYDELRRMADAELRRVPGGRTLQPTALVHEAYLRLLGKPVDFARGDGEQFECRRHFFFVAARAMRDILIERARTKGVQARRRAEPIDAERIAVALETAPSDLVSLHDALGRLERESRRSADVVTLRFFGGLTTEQAASVLGVSVPTAERDWRFARVRLHEMMTESPGDA